MMRCWRRYLFIPLLLWSSACSLFGPPPDRFGAKPVAFDHLSGWSQDNQAQALQGFIASCSILEQKARGTSSGSGLQVPEPVWQSLCDEARRLPPGDDTQARLFFERRFVPYRVTNNDKEAGLFTGYYEPVLYGSHRKYGNFVYPVYAAPPELKNHKLYFTREEIDHGALEHRKLELAWVDDPVMLFFMQIQGSGRIRLTDGTEMHLGYAGQNGYPYVSLGKVVGDEGLMPKDQINFFSLRQWLYDHHDQAFAMMEHNPSYVFFRRLDSPAAVGAVGAPLVPQRSLAVDSRYIPYGLPLYMEAALPALPGAVDPPFDRLMIAQDTGGAIRGPVRADIFFGAGHDAEYLAGYMKGHGVYSLLVPKEIAYQLQ